MSDRHTVDTITSDALDALYADRDQLRADCQKWADLAVAAEKTRRAHAADSDQYEASVRDRAERAEATIDRVRAVAAEWGEPYHCGWLSASVLVRQLRAALDEQQPTT